MAPRSPAWREAGGRRRTARRLVVADRAEPDAYDSVAQAEWDEVVDISSIPEHVAAAVDALASRARHWTYISSLSVYADDDEVGADESAALHEPAVPGEEYDYGRAKSAAEASVRAGTGRPRGDHPSRPDRRSR